MLIPSLLNMVKITFKLLNIVSLIIIMYILFYDDYYIINSPISMLQNYGNLFLILIGVLNIITLLYKYNNIYISIITFPFSGSIPFLGFKIYLLELFKRDSFFIKSWLEIRRKYTDNEKINISNERLNDANFPMTEEVRSTILGIDKISDIKTYLNNYINEEQNKIIQIELEHKNKIQMELLEQKINELSYSGHLAKTEILRLKRIMVEIKKNNPDLKIEHIPNRYGGSVPHDWHWLLKFLYDTAWTLMPYILIASLFFIVASILKDSVQEHNDIVKATSKMAEKDNMEISTLKEKVEILEADIKITNNKVDTINTEGISKVNVSKIYTEELEDISKVNSDNISTNMTDEVVDTMKEVAALKKNFSEAKEIFGNRLSMLETFNEYRLFSLLKEIVISHVDLNLLTEYEQKLIIDLLLLLADIKQRDEQSGTAIFKEVMKIINDGNFVKK